jgi:hypothetical protein
MTLKAELRTVTFSDMVADPLFRTGYEEIWRGEDHAVDIRWSDNEQLAYERGRHFGLYVKGEDGRRVPLIGRSGGLNPRAQVLIVAAFRDGALR